MDLYEHARLRMVALETASSGRESWNSTAILRDAELYYKFLTQDILPKNEGKSSNTDLDEAVVEVLKEPLDEDVVIDLNTEEFKDDEMFSNEGVFHKDDQSIVDKETSSITK